MEIRKIVELLDAEIVCGADKIDEAVKYGFASDLMSDVLTLDSEGIMLVTGLTNLQTIRTAEMADITCIMFVRNKEITDEMKALAEENGMVLLECKYSMYKTVGMLHVAGLDPVY